MRAGRLECTEECWGSIYTGSWEGKDSVLGSLRSGNTRQEQGEKRGRERARVIQWKESFAFKNSGQGGVGRLLNCRAPG